MRVGGGIFWVGGCGWTFFMGGCGWVEVYSRWARLSGDFLWLGGGGWRYILGWWGWVDIFYGWWVGVSGVCHSFQYNPYNYLYYLDYQFISIWLKRK